MHNKQDSQIRKAEEATFFFGKHNLDSLSGEQGYIVSGVTQLIVHPDWNFLSDRFDADIALAVLLRTVEFSSFVRPICIWTETTSYTDLVGKNGIIAGWGKTEFTAVSTATPMWTKLPVVATQTCINSNYKFSLLTSDRTFCAGDRTGETGPCNGDSDKFT